MFDTAWMTRWQSAVNTNGPMSWLGKHLTADILLGFATRISSSTSATARSRASPTSWARKPAISSR